MVNRKWLVAVAFALTASCRLGADAATVSVTETQNLTATAAAELALTTRALPPASLSGELVLGTGAIHDSPATGTYQTAHLMDMVSQQRFREEQMSHDLFSEFAWLTHIAKMIYEIQQVVEQVKLADDTIALGVKYGADFLEFINSLSGPRSGRFFYDSATIRQVNRTINEYNKLKHWKASFGFDFEFPTDRVAQPTGVRWDTINRRLGVAVDKLDETIAEVRNGDGPIRSALSLASNNAIQRLASSTVLEGTRFTNKLIVNNSKINQMMLSVLSEMAELEGQKTNAMIMKEIQKDLSENGRISAATSARLDGDYADFVSRMAILKAGGTGSDAGARQMVNRFMGSNFLSEGDDSSLSAPSGASFSNTSVWKGQ